MTVNGSLYKSHHRIFQVENRVLDTALKTYAITAQFCYRQKSENILKLHN